MNLSKSDFLSEFFQKKNPTHDHRMIFHDSLAQI